MTKITAVFRAILISLVQVAIVYGVAYIMKNTREEFVFALAFIALVTANYKKDEE